MIKSKNLPTFYFTIFALFLSIILFRGRLGSDDLEVFNFVYNFKIFEGNFIEYLEILKNEEESRTFLSDNQKHTYYTFHHRLIWVIQTFIIYNVVESFFGIFNYKSLFFLQYFSGIILSFYTILSLYFCFLYLKKEKMDKNLSILLILVIFLSTGLISLFTGQYIESLAVLILSIRLNVNNKIILFLLDFFLITIKPFYFLIVFVLRIIKLEENIFYFSKNNLKIYFNIFILLMFYLLLRYILIGVEGNLVYFKSQDPNFDILKYLENFYNFYFSLGTGLFFTSIIPLLLIFLGKNKNTVFKLIAIFFLSFVLSFFEGFHGCAPGIRYFLPFLIIFFPEYKAGIEKIFQKNFFLLFIALIAILNIPTLEYRNFHITEYINGTVYSNKSFGVGKIKNNELDLFKWPINSLKFNNVIFSNIVLFHKILGSKDFKVNEFKIKVENIYPQTGLGRIIFIGKNNINLKYKFIERISAKYNKIFSFLYYSFLLSFLIYFFYLIKILYKKY